AEAWRDLVESMEEPSPRVKDEGAGLRSSGLETRWALSATWACARQAGLVCWSWRTGLAGMCTGLRWSWARMCVGVVPGLRDVGLRAGLEARVGLHAVGTLVDQPCLPGTVARLQALRLQIPTVKAFQRGVLRHRVCSEPVYSKRLPGDHVLRESEPFLHVGADVRHFEQYAQVRIYKAKLFDGLSQGDHAWHDDVLEVSGRKQLELGLDMAKVRRALNMPLRFREWRWLLSEHLAEDSGLLPAEDVEMWKQNGPDPDDLLTGQDEYSAGSLSKRKAAAKSSRGEATFSHTKNGSPSRKKPKLPSAEKTQVGFAP
ncbi:Protein kinase family protein with leucine-rich repeat domain, partial [Prunus dulcis]